MEYNFDISRLKEYRSAVQFSCDQEADAFMNYMKKSHPSVARLFAENTNFGFSGRFGGYDCATLFGHDSQHPDTMTRSTVGHFRGRGFNIVPFVDILVEPEISEAESNFSFLMGGI